METPEPKLKEGVIYYGDNGRRICVKCAGQTAKFTGRDTSGKRVRAATLDDALGWQEMFMRHLSCENGCTFFLFPVEA
jgi:hypothetical protein